jgi:hypothetical protein
MSSPVFPTEIIYEINTHIPFHSFMWILSKDTHKYWLNKTLYSDKATQEDKKKNINLFILRNTKNLIQARLIDEIIPSVKYVVSTESCTSMRLYNLIGQKHSVRIVNFGGWKVGMSLLLGLEGINITNYEIMLGPDSREFVLSRIPHAIKLFEMYMNSYDSWTREDYRMRRNWHIGIKKDKIITYVTEYIVLSKPEVLNLSEYLYLNYVDMDYDVCCQIANEITSKQNLKACVIDTRFASRKDVCKKAFKVHINSKISPKIIII